MASASLNKPATGFIAFDLDSTLILDEGIDELAREYGRYDEVARITEKAMTGALLFESSFAARLSVLRGLGADRVAAVLARIRITPGAAPLVAELRARGYRSAILSGGFHFIGDAIAERLGIDHVVANHLELRDGKVTGEPVFPIVDGQAKAAHFRKFVAIYGVPRERTIAVGDGANDLPMLAEAGISASFNGKDGRRSRRSAPPARRKSPRPPAVLTLSGRAGAQNPLASPPLRRQNGD